MNSLNYGVVVFYVFKNFCTCTFLLTICFSDGAKAIENKDTQPALIEGQALASGNGEAHGVFVYGLTAGETLVMKAVSKSLDDSSLRKFKTCSGVLVNRAAAEQLDIKVNDTLTLFHPTGEETPLGVFPLVVRYLVLGEAVGVVDQNISSVYMCGTEAKKFSKKLSGKSIPY